MRIQSLAATALAAAGFLNGVAAQTVTIYRTVERVVDTATAWSSSATLSSYAPSYPVNGTSVLPTGTGGYPSTSYATPVEATGAATNLRFDTAGLAAVVGLIGLAAL